ncbi:O-antigen ligase family protein [Planctomyces sp. SH-PL14]|uniref:O-antigen ligase family protein n=1 Tax=Planctomyces sp. SH-PL14 TaxID=1632864 RepID=UPI00078B55A4|nr:O-antigen ligase family protein [Planctomyces sp. SH-PL14]AMV19698.1 hypothetical protein VT03_17510 [Planctomyces sp. SH-PL14]
MAYILFLMANAALFLRPAELFPAMGDFPLYMYLITAAIFASAHQILDQLRPRNLFFQPVSLCVILVTIATAISHLSLGDVGSAIKSINAMAKVMLYYLTLLSVINTPQRLRTFLVTTALSATVMITLSIVDYRDFVAEWSGRDDLEIVREEEKDLFETNEPRRLRHVVDWGNVSEDGQQQWIFRITGLGMFRDPNDFALVLNLTIIISCYFLADRQLSSARYLWAIPIALSFYGLYLTHSRGGLLGTGVALMAWMSTKYGGRVALMIGLMGAAAVPVALGRQGNIDVSGGTGQQRIQLWADGLNQMKTSRAVFGIGEGKYPDVAGLVAHNSFIHAYVELGFVGGTFFFGCFFLPAWAFYLMKRYRFRIEDHDLERMFPYMAAIVGGWCMGMASLSRCYVPPTYMICGTAAAFLNLVGYYRARPVPVLVFNHGLARHLAVCSFGFLLCCFVFVRLFVRY